MSVGALIYLGGIGMTKEITTQPKVIREWDLVDPQGVRVDFYMENGPIASSYDQMITTMISIELTILGYQIEDYPQVAEKSNETPIS